MINTIVHQNPNSSYLAKIVKSTCKTTGYFGIGASNLEYFIEQKIKRAEGKYEINFNLLNNTNEKNEFTSQIKQAVIQILTEINNCSNNLDKNKICEFSVKGFSKGGEKFDLYIENNEIYFLIRTNDLDESEKFVLFQFDSMFSFDNLKEKIKYILENPNSPFEFQRIDMNSISKKLFLGRLLLGFAAATIEYFRTMSYERSFHVFVIGFLTGSLIGILLKSTITHTRWFGKYNSNSLNKIKEIYKHWLINTNRIFSITAGELKQIIEKNKEEFTTADSKIIINLISTFSRASIEELKDEDKLVLVPRIPKRFDKSKVEMKKPRVYDISTVDDLFATITQIRQNKKELSFNFRVWLENINYTEFMSHNQLRKLLKDYSKSGSDNQVYC